MNHTLRIACLASALAVLSCGQASEPPNLLLITIDTVRADRLGCYGYAAARTPAIDALAAEGILFERAFSPYPLTLPAHTSMLSGHLPFEHGIRNNDQIVTGDESRLITEILRDRGYQTAAAVSAFVLDEQFGLARGFSVYEDDLGPAANGRSAKNERSAAATTDVALALLDQMQDGPFFLWVHYFDPHHPYAPPVAFEGDPYDGEIAYMDRHIERLLQGLKERALYADAAVLMAGDHGEAFGEHEELQHGLFVYDATLHVPLVLKLPQKEGAGRRVTVAASLTDVAPTLLGLAGIDDEEFRHAEDLRRLRGRETGDTRALYAETLSPYFNHGASPLACVRVGDWKYVEAPTPELYHLSTDPGETDNLASVRPELARRLRSQLASLHPLDWMSAPDPLAEVRTDAAARERLASLGYVSAAGAPEPQHRPDPKIIAQVQARIREGDRALSRRDIEGAERAFREAMNVDPRNWKASWKLARIYEQRDDLDAAAQLFRDALERNPANITAHFNLGRILVQKGQYAEALGTLDHVIQAKPDYANAHTLRGVALFKLGKRDEARAAWEEALRHDASQELAAEYLSSTLDLPTSEGH